MKLKIKTDSRKVEDGDIFVALKGYTVDGHDFIQKAIENGAGTVVCERDNDYTVDTVVVEDSKQYLIDYLKQHYNQYLSKMKIIGITGTNGKTTCANLLHNLLNQTGVKTAYIGTLGFYIGKKIQSLPNTTPDVLELYEFMLHAYEVGCEYVIMEVSSQGLDDRNRRVEGFTFDIAMFTNLTQDHLDFHKTMGNYALAKQKLFYKLKPGGVAVVNYDDQYRDYYLLENNKNITYGLTGGDYQASDIQMTSTGSKFTLRSNGMVEKIETSLIGEYNIYNLLSIITILLELGYTITDIKKMVRKLKMPDGRMDTVAYGSNSIIVDYAHTADAIKKILDTMHQVNPKHIYVVFGCTGDRDRLKRPIMTKIVSDLTDHMIITIDDPHYEDPKQVVDDMIEGLEQTNYEVILDRAKAIHRGIDLLKDEDILLVLGKGHEEVILFRDQRIPFNDKQEILKYLEQIKIHND
ncbi:MAG: UDP-N-acetylmuramoyl-L-alanyl-D-glutamate--2,6-diaminopimelate ligase [Bacilli bacterium]|nr:UDP-N-acetylmuramoyl-L-alanyl-D-glutamate--2,6-diaminopimelate ligase [Bacilli bacterium]